MSKKNSTSDGFLIALAWPETKCKQAGAWYDGLMKRTGFNKEGYYAVGHAALVLVDKSDSSCTYYDFGRYHSPYGHGRVRSAYTDHDLKMSVKADIQEGKLINLKSILEELYHNPSTHGDGTIYGKEVLVNLQDTQQYINEMLGRVFIPYGPFKSRGTNCSRFVNSALIAGHASLWIRFRLHLPWTVSPSPLEILRVLGKDISTFGSQKNNQPRQYSESSVELNLSDHEIA